MFARGDLAGRIRARIGRARGSPKGWLYSRVFQEAHGGYGMNDTHRFPTITRN